MSYLVGYSPYKDDRGAIDLAAQFARSEPATVEAITVVPRGWGTPAAAGTDREFEQWAAAEGAAGAAEAAALLADHADIESTTGWQPGRSVPPVLLERAAAAGASMVIVGSGENGPRGHVTVTSKTDRVLHSSDVPVAIAPRGYRAPAGSRITRVTVGFRDDDPSWSLLERVADICRRVSASLRIVTFAIRPRTMVSARVSIDDRLVFQQWKDQARAGLAEASAHLASTGFDGALVETVLAEGRSWGGAIDDVEWARGDVLVVGSSSTHRLGQVFLGSSAAKILRNSAVPVIVVP